MIAGFLVVAAAFHYDSIVDGWFAHHAVKSWKNFATGVSRYGDWPPLMGFAAVALGGAWFWRQNRTKHLLIAMMVAASVAGIAANGVRVVAGRTRPNAGEKQGWHFLGTADTSTIAKYKYSSFPSAHTTTAFGFTAPVILLAFYRQRRRWLLIPAIAIPLLVGWSRLYLHVHHFSDVVVATMLGLACGFQISHIGPWKTLYGGTTPVVEPTTEEEPAIEPAAVEESSRHEVCS